jgi:energy-coupling factor transporter transmembrane protein EcfT
METLGGEAAERDLGPWLLAAAFALFLVELIAALGLRGLWRPRRFALPALLLLALVPWQVSAQGADGSAALATRLAYIQTGDAAVDETSRSGLAGLADFVNRRTAAALAEPHGVTPGQDDLSFYPLLYWPIMPDAPAPSTAMVAALNDPETRQAFAAQGGTLVGSTPDEFTQAIREGSARWGQVVRAGNIKLE